MSTKISYSNLPNSELANKFFNSELAKKKLERAKKAYERDKKLLQPIIEELSKR